MNTTTNPKFHGLDHLRALAILLVFLYHYLALGGGEPEWLFDVAGFGWTGVDLFFVLSGFLISSQLFAQIKKGENISFQDFFLKRFFRIIPAYWVVLVLYFTIPMFHERESLPPLWRFLTFTQNFGLDLKTSGTFSHAWSLCVEEHFYLFLPVILFVLYRNNFIKKGFWLLLLLFAAGFLIRMYSYEHFYKPVIDHPGGVIEWYKYIYYPTYNRLDGLLVGVSIAAIYQFQPVWWSRLSKFGNWWLLSGLLVLTGAYFLCEDQTTFSASVFGFPLVALGYGLVVSGAVSSSSFLYRWNSKITTTIAALSYAIYLTHKGVVHVAHVLLRDYEINANLMLIMSMSIAVLAAYVLHLLVERPFMRLRRKLLAV